MRGGISNGKMPPRAWRKRRIKDLKSATALANAESTIWENRQLAQMQNQRFKKIASWRKRRINDLRKSPVGANAESTI